MRNKYFLLLREVKGMPKEEAIKKITSDINGDLKTKYIN